MNDENMIFDISIHALLAESDILGALWVLSTQIFLSTLSLRRATSSIEEVSKYVVISIHALLAESDILLLPLLLQTFHFYPRSPCGERPWARGSRVTYVEFLSTLSLRRATPMIGIDKIPNQRFLSTLSLRRATIGTLRTVSVRNTFLSTLSLRRATEKNNGHETAPYISIHALLAESDWLELFLYYQDNISIHALLAESDQ